MRVLGLGSPFLHDPAAALVVDGEVVAAAEEERFSRHKHAVRELPVEAARYCLSEAKLQLSDVDCIALAWSPDSYRRDLPGYLRRTWRTRPSRALKALRSLGAERRRREQRVHAVCRALGQEQAPRIEWVDHHLAHAASAYLLSGFDSAAILTIDGSGEFTSTLMAEGLGGEIRPLRSILNPDSLGFLYSTVTEYLGFERDDGEYKTMGMSAYGDPARIDISPLIELTRNGDSGYRINDELVWCVARRRFRRDKMYGRKLVEMWGPPRTGEGLAEPYVHVAAAAQKVLEDAALSFLDTTLAPVLERTNGRLCLAGGCALNVRMNRKLLAHPAVQELWVQPGSNDAGAPLGAAVWVAHRAGDRIAPMRHAYLGPAYDDAPIEAVLDRFRVPNVRLAEGQLIEEVARLLAQGEVVAWFQGRMEFGPRALGNRSILGNPTVPGTSDRINREIKFRETWRPFCPSIAEELAPQVLDGSHPSPFMNLSFLVNPAWRGRIPEAVHVDGSARPQIVSRDTNPRFHALLRAFAEKSGVAVLINTSLNRRGEPMVCSPEDALRTFFGSGLGFLVLGDRLVAKDARRLPASSSC